MGDKFFSFIPGMSSRIGNHIDFPNYEVDELSSRSKVMSRDLDYEMTDEAGDVFKKYIERRMAMPFFSNARTVRNAMDRARMNAAIRVFDQAIAGATAATSAPRTSRSSRRFLHIGGVVCVYSWGRR